MYELLKGLTVVECSSFVASPSAGLYLSQMGADVIRIDPIGGGPDFNRWPVSERGDSFYWEGLNKGKKSVTVDIRSPEGRALVQRLAVSGGEQGGLFLTNYPAKGFLSHDVLSELRPDLITCRIMGHQDGRTALDYTVNSAVGVPYMTGPPELGDQPVNHALPAWDLLAGAYAAFSILAALRHRDKTGEGQEVRVSLADLAITSLANLGQVAEVIAKGADRERCGNDVFGTYGRDFVTRDNRRLMIMAITTKQWKALVDVLGIASKIEVLEEAFGVSLSQSDSFRYEKREYLHPIVEAAVHGFDYATLTEALTKAGGCWGPYQMLSEAIEEPALIKNNPIFKTMENRSGMSYPIPGAAAMIPSQKRHAARPASELGTDTRQVIQSLLTLEDSQISQLFDQGIIAEPEVEDAR